LAAVGWRLTWREGGRVERVRAASLAAALDGLEARGRAAAAGPGLARVDLRARRWEPGDRVAARGEVRGPQRWRADVAAGIDVRGDGSVRAWTGGVARAPVAARGGEDAYAALRRTLRPQSVSVEP
jgi:hypothetical protein